MDILSPSPIFWLIFTFILLAIEAGTLGLTTIWFAAGSLCAFVLAIFGCPLWSQVIVFLAVSLLSILFIRKWVVGKFNKKRERTNADAVIGKKGVVIEDIDNLKATGRVSVNGMEWAAKSEGDEVIPKDTVVVVSAIKGVKLVVEERMERENDGSCL